MISSIIFKNFKVLRDTTLPLGWFTLLVGANGSGKSTALQALETIRSPSSVRYERVMNVDLAREVVAGKRPSDVELQAAFVGGDMGGVLRVTWAWSPPRSELWTGDPGGPLSDTSVTLYKNQANRIQVYALDPRNLHAMVPLDPEMALGRNGEGLAGVLDRLRDQAPERFEALTQELGRLLPEFDRILFGTPERGHRAFYLRLRDGKLALPALDLSQGTLLALAMLTLAYLPEPPPIIGLEEPDRGIHPRLLRDVKDVLYRLCYPKEFGEDRPPVQVVATTQSPYFLDLFKDHPEEIVIAQKEGHSATFSRLQDHPHIAEILSDAPLGEVWYSGILGGVPKNR